MTPERACKRCGALASTGARFRDNTVKGKLVKRGICYQCELAAKRGKPKSRAGAPFAVVIGDTHFPFHHPACLKWALDLIADLEPQHVVQVGDLYDRFSQSKFPRNHSAITPGEELTSGREAAEAFWQSVRARSPHSKCFQLYGNHDDRPLKRALEAAPELLEMVLPSVRGLHEFPGVTTMRDSKTELILDGVVFMHGYESRPGAHAAKNHASTVHGHTHHGGTWFRSDGRGTFWELDAGCVVDLDSPAFDYRVQRKLYGVTLGVGVIDRSGPRFIPFVG